MAKTKPNEKTLVKKRGRPFEKGNPGRPIGARNKSTVFLENILQGDSETIVRKAIELAREGEVHALRMCFERLMGARRDRPVSFPMPSIKTSADGAAAMNSLLEAIARGDVTPAEGTQLAQLIRTTVEMFERDDLIKRIERIERGEVDGLPPPDTYGDDTRGTENVGITLPATSLEKKRMGGG